ncbi:MAG: TIGR04211 family SH3 domain-containing protein [Gammaproteobacteria bacterium]|nr:TIGR04211 family SH3 domain-containing protein [Gammaproteobacteria bacterium]
MDKKITKVSLLALFTSVLMTNSVHAMQEQEPQETTTSQEQTTLETEQTLEPTAGEETVQAAVQEESSIESVTPYKMFVTDELFIFVHSGSSNRYRITGRIAASEEVEVVAKDNETGWLQVNYGGNKSGWVNNEMITSDSGAKEKLSKAQQQIRQLTAELEKIKAQPGVDVDQMNQQMANLKTDNQQLLKQVESLNQQKTELEASIQQIDETRKILDKLYDVGVILIGVFIGWLLSRRKRSGISFNHL